jgi:hypothetical protein
MTDDTEEETSSLKQCFTSIQSRKFLGNLESFNLCPSMDLVVYGTSESIHQHNLYRTMSWQKVASITPDTTTATITSETEQEAGAAAAAHPAVTCWSPSGRWIAVAIDKTVSLYGVEPLANPPGGAGFSNESTEAQHSWTVDHPVTGLFWAHVGRAHPTAWKTVEDEAEEELSWRYVVYNEGSLLLRV